MSAYDRLNSERLVFLMGGGLMLGTIVFCVLVGVAIDALKRRRRR